MRKLYFLVLVMITLLLCGCSKSEIIKVTIIDGMIQTIETDSLLDIAIIKGKEKIIVIPIKGIESLLYIGQRVILKKSTTITSDFFGQAIFTTLQLKLVDINKNFYHSFRILSSWEYYGK
jgi:hypothetical protein